MLPPTPPSMPLTAHTVEKHNAKLEDELKSVWAAQKRKLGAEAEAESQKAKAKAAGLRLKDWWEAKKSETARKEVDTTIKKLEEEKEEESEQADEAVPGHSKIDPRDL